MGNAESPEVIFLLGAGASVKADVPDTFKFVKEFQNSINNIEDRRTIDQIIETLKEWQNSDIDVELLLETLTKLNAKEQEPLLRFYKNGEFILSGYSEKRPIIESLKDFIKRKAIIESQEKIRYLEPLLGFVEEYKPLNIFSVNYDTCVEQFCSVHKLIYQDGFDVNWNPQVFEREETDIRLYKIHGSVIWYKSDRAGYIKLPIMTPEAKIKLITGEKAESLMLYPMQKFDYAEPILELLMRLRKVIQSCKVLIVVGYSFRDVHLMRILLDVARKNLALSLILVDPKASQIYNDRLKYFDPQLRIPSSLEERVVCLPYKFEEVLPLLKDHYLRNLQSGLRIISSYISSERKGTKVNWVECLQPLINAEHTEKVQALLNNKIPKSDLENQWQLNIEILIKMSMNLAANGQIASSDKYVNDLKLVLRGILCDNIGLRVIQVPNSKNISPMFNWRKDGTGTGSINAVSLNAFLQNQYEYLTSRSKMVIDDSYEQQFAFIKVIINYLATFTNDWISFEEFVSLRKQYIEDPEKLRKLSLSQTTERSPFEAFSEAILAIEKKVTSDLFK